MNAHCWRRTLLSLVAATLGGLLLLGGDPPALAQGPGQDPGFAADRELFHDLLEHRDAIRRTVRPTERGVETLTESDQPEVAAAIQRHVASMERRVKQRQPIHLRDPLFAELFRHADKIRFTHEKTPRGSRVTEVSDDPYVVKLIQAHAEVVSRFLAHGPAEVRRNHDVPPRP